MLGVSLLVHVQAVSLELIVELLLSKSHRLAVYYALAGIDRFVG